MYREVQAVWNEIGRFEVPTTTALKSRPKCGERRPRRLCRHRLRSRPRTGKGLAKNRRSLTYYYNFTTGEISWENPEKPAAASSAAAAGRAAAKKLATKAAAKRAVSDDSTDSRNFVRAAADAAAVAAEKLAVERFRHAEESHRRAASKPPPPVAQPSAQPLKATSTDNLVTKWLFQQDDDKPSSPPPAPAPAEPRMTFAGSALLPAMLGQRLTQGTQKRRHTQRHSVRQSESRGVAFSPPSPQYEDDDDWYSYYSEDFDDVEGGGSSPSYEQETGGGGRAANDPVLSGALADLNKPVADVLASHEEKKETSVQDELAALRAKAQAAAVQREKLKAHNEQLLKEQEDKLERQRLDALRTPTPTAAERERTEKRRRAVEEAEAKAERAKKEAWEADRRRYESSPDKQPLYGRPGPASRGGSPEPPAGGKAGSIGQGGSSSSLTTTAKEEKPPPQPRVFGYRPKGAAASAPPIDNNVPATPVAYEPNTSGAGSGAPAQTKGVAMSAAAQRQAKLRAHNEAMMRKQQEAQQSAAVEESAPAPQTVDERAQLESKKKAAAAKPAPKKKGGWFGSKKK